MLAVPLPRQVRVVCGELHPHIIGDNAVSHLIRGILNQGFDLLLDLSSSCRGVAFVRGEPSTCRAGQLGGRQRSGVRRH